MHIGRSTGSGSVAALSVQRHHPGHRAGAAQRAVRQSPLQCVKYAAGKPVHVSVQAIDGAARLAVRDYGIGISKEDIPRIFERESFGR
jgi:hypothetical protein